MSGSDSRRRRVLAYIRTGHRFPQLTGGSRRVNGTSRRNLLGQACARYG